MKHYYQVVSSIGRFGLEYLVYEARKDDEGAIQISSTPLKLVGNTIEEIEDTLKQILGDMKDHPPVERFKCRIFAEEPNEALGEDALEIDDIYDMGTEEELIREFGHVERFGV